MFRAPLCPSSGACDYTDVHNIWHITITSGLRAIARRAIALNWDPLPTATHHTHDQHNQGYVPHAVNICVVAGS